jgi:hypothetical protein
MTLDIHHLIAHPSFRKDWSRSVVLAVILLPLAIYAFLLLFRSKIRRLSLPPGPKGLPILGNLLQIHNAQTKSWLMYRNWSEQHGTDWILKARKLKLISLGTRYR